MLKFYRTFLVAAQQVSILLLLAVPGTATAASPVERLAVEARIDNDGNVTVVQTIDYITPSQLDWMVFSQIRSLEAAADSNDLGSSELTRQSSNGATLLTSQEFASRWTISYRTPSSLIRHNNRDQFFLKILDRPDRPIYRSTITFSLPEGAGSTTNLSGNIYSLSGVVDPVTKISERRAVFSTGYIAPASLLTVSVNWDKGVITLTPLAEARLSFLQLDAAPWLAFGLLLPLASLIVLATLLLRQKRQELATDGVSPTQPSTLSPALVGVLVRKKIYPEEIAALLIDLCGRGYLIVVKRADGYYLAKRKELDEHVEQWEREIVEEMFGTKGRLADQHLEDIGSSKLYSPRVRDAFRQIYEVITRRSFFRENPHLTRVRNKLVALLIYYGSAAAMVWVAVSFNSPYLILPLAGTMAVAVLIIKTAPKLATYSNKGVVERRKWQEFGNYLKANKPLPFESARNHVFEKYLAYAVALGVTLQWARRFDLSSIALIKPDWFVTYEEGSTVEFAKDIVGFTNQISRGISNLRGPLVS